MTRFQTLRMIWIDAWLTRSDCPLRRAHLKEVFDLSTAQAAIDFGRFQRAWPRRMDYDASAKGYRPADGSAPVFAPWMHESVFAAGRAVTEAIALVPP